MNIFVDDVYLLMNTETTDENILRYLKFIVISGDSKTQKNRDGVSQKEYLQLHSLDIIFFVQVVPFSFESIYTNF